MVAARATRASILVIEDDPDMARLEMDALEDSDYRVWHAADGREARELVERIHPDLVVLDLMLPDIDGLVLTISLKSMSDVPIIVCSASARRSDPVLALKLGADDFVRKPFEIDDLLARIEAVLRRVPHTNSNSSRPTVSRSADLRVGELLIEPSRRRVVLGGDDLVLTPTEFRLLLVLAARAERVLTRDQLAHEVWGYADASNGRTIDVHVRRLRIKLGQSRVQAPTIVSVRGIGYRITADEASITAA